MGRQRCHIPPVLDLAPAAENLAESLTKGTRILLTGVLRQHDWETSDGETRTSFQVDATEIGASLKWATVTVNKTTRTTATTTGEGNTDPWTTTPANPDTGDKPPF